VHGLSVPIIRKYAEVRERDFTIAIKVDSGGNGLGREWAFVPICKDTKIRDIYFTVAINISFVRIRAGCFWQYRGSND
jgi:hypothetical protein